MRNSSASTGTPLVSVRLSLDPELEANEIQYAVDGHTVTISQGDVHKNFERMRSTRPDSE